MTLKKAIKSAEKMIIDGVDIIDIGGESTDLTPLQFHLRKNGPELARFKQLVK